MRPHPRQHPISLYLVTSPRSPPLFGLHWADLHVPFLRKIKQFLFWERLRFNRIFKTSNTGVTLMVRIRFTLAGIRVFLVKMVFFLSPVPPPHLSSYMAVTHSESGLLAQNPSLMSLPTETRLSCSWSSSVFTARCGCPVLNRPSPSS